MSKPRLLTVPLILAGMTLFMGALVPNLFVLAPRYLARIGYDEQQIGLVMGGFNVGSLGAMILAGRLSERLGHSRVLVIGCLVAGAGCGVFEIAGSIPAFTVARVIQGAGFAAVLVAGAAYVAEIAPPSRLAQALGIAGVLTLCSQAVGPALGEVLEQHAGWAWVFRAGGIGGAAGAVVAAFLPAASSRSADGGASTASAWPILVATGLAALGFGAVWVFLADYSDRVGVGAVTPFFVTYVIAAISARVFLGHLPDTLGRRAAGVPALFLHAVALLVMSQLASRWHMIGVGAAFGLAHGIYYPALQAMIVERAPAARSRAIAASTMAFGTGIVVAAFGLGAVAKYHGYPVIYAIAAAAGVVAALTVWLRG